VPIRKRRGWPWLLAIPVIAAAAVAAIWLAWPVPATRSGPAIPAVRSVAVKKTAVERTLRISGSITAAHSVYLLTPQLPGRGSRGGGGFHLILSDIAPGGTRVRKGDVVASFDTMHMLNRLDDYRAEVVQHQSLIKRMQARLDIRRAQHQQRVLAAKARVDTAVLDLKTAPVRSQIQIEKFRLAREEAEAQYQELLKQSELLDISELAAIRRYELMLREAELEMRRAQTNADKMVVRAPMDGLVVLTSVRRGSEYGQVQAGDQMHPGHSFMQIVDPGSTIVSGALNQADAEHIRMGAPARVYLDAYPGLSFPAKVVGISGFARAGGYRGDYVRSMTIRLAVEGSDPRVIPDLSACADVTLAASEESPAVPLEYVQREKDGTRVYIREGGRWEPREIRTGFANHVQAAVSEGLGGGEVIGHPDDVHALNGKPIR
jgi:multidrug efflux pump subunit AcrA (membrane-fusion protein)